MEMHVFLIETAGAIFNSKLLIIAKILACLLIEINELIIVIIISMVTS